MSKINVTIALPEAAASSAAAGAPVIVRNAKLAIVEQGALDKPIALDPGIYAAETVLPDGREFDVAFEVRGGPDKGFELEPSGGVAQSPGDFGSIAASSAAPGDLSISADIVAAEPGQLSVVPRADNPQAFDPGGFGEPPGGFGGPPGGGFFPTGGVLGGAADHFGGGGGGLGGAIGGYDGGGLFSRNGPGLPQDVGGADEPAGWEWTIAQWPGGAEAPAHVLPEGTAIQVPPLDSSAMQGSYLRVRRSGFADRNYALPVSHSEGATLAVAPDGSVRFTLDDREADLVLGYLANQRVAELVQLAASDGPLWQAMFNSDEDRPIAGTLGAYAMLIAGPASAERGSSHPWDWSDFLSWSEALVDNRRAPPDSLAIRGELLARQGLHDQALLAFAQMFGRGRPVFSIGLRLALDRLVAYAATSKVSTAEVDIDGMLRELGDLAAFVDFEQPVLNFTTGPDGKLSTRKRQ